MKLTNQVPERNRAVFDIFTICIDKYMLPPQTWKPLSPGRTSDLTQAKSTATATEAAVLRPKSHHRSGEISTVIQSLFLLFQF